MIRILQKMKLIWLFLLLLPSLVLAQADEYEWPKQKRRLSRMALNTPEEYTYSTYHLVNALSRDATTDQEKLWTFYVWIANNITYDMIGFEKDQLPDSRPKAVLHNRLAVCQGYAQLFNELCAEAGIRSEVIKGYAKGYGYEKGQQFGVSNHAWNAVYLDNAWQLIDVTWAARKRNDKTTSIELNEAYFLTPPTSFVMDHLPEIPAWQLLPSPISKEKFESSAITLDSVGNYNYSDTLEALLEKPKTERTITYQLMAREFNPANDAANYALAAEYRFRGLDILETIYNVETMDTAVFNRLEKESFAAFNEAALYFTLIKPGSRYYRTSQVFLDDTDFERGVFKYEVAHRLIELYNRKDAEEKKKLRLSTEEMILHYYAEAAEYFELIPRHSWYYEKAQEYLNEYLRNPFEPG